MQPSEIIQAINPNLSSKPKGVNGRQWRVTCWIQRRQSIMETAT